MENKHNIPSNKPIPRNVENVIEDLTQNGQEILFVIVGDLNLKGEYADTALVFTRKSLISVGNEDGDIKEYLYRDLSDTESKRMYGNAVLTAVMPDGNRKIIFRYTYTVTRLCDTAALFINHINYGSDFDDELLTVKNVFERVLSVCPKCGRQLLHPGAECIKCRSKFKVFKIFSKYIKPQTKHIIISVILSLFTTVMALLPPMITGFIVDVIFNGESRSDLSLFNGLTDFTDGDSLKLLTVMIIVLFLTYVFQYGVGIYRSYLMRVIGDKCVTDLRNDIYRKAQNLPMGFYDKTSTGSVINRISGDSNTLQQFMLRITQEAVIQFFQLIGIVVIMISLNFKLTLLSLIPIIFIIITTRYFGKKIRPFYRRIWRRWSAVVSNLSDTIPCVKVVKAFSGEERAADNFTDKNNDWLSVDLKLGKLVTAFPQIVSFLVTCGSIFIWAVGGKNVITGADGYSAGLIVAFISYASMFYNPVSFFANLTDSFQGAMASVEKILDILEAEPELRRDTDIMPDKLKGKIEFSHVGFSFDRSKKVLDNVSFTIEPGEVVGIVGTTGSGKTTLINLLMRFYDNYSGRILIDGRDIRNFNLSAYRDEIGFVQQDPMMFSDTIYNNIAFSKPNATVEQVINAADVANAHDFIARQPDAYDTVLGERGVGISGGEKQRISIARAVLRNPSILIFDEATAAVDSETEHLIQEAIDRLIVGKTTIMIAHRLSTLKKANRIIVVDNGRIIENGTPAELLAKKGKYYKLVQIQSMTADAERMREEERL